jgi:O-antigen/teichoic acid export membrane protein
MGTINFFKFAAISIIAQGVGILLPFIVGYFFIPSEFAIFSLGLMISSFFLAILINPTQTPYIIFSIEEKNCTGKINETFTIQCITFVSSALIAGLLFMCFRNTISSFSGISNTQVISLYFAYLGLAIKSNISSYFLSLDRKKMSAFVELIFNLTSIIYVLSAYFFGILSIGATFFAYLISGLIVLIFFIFKADYSLITPLSFNKEMFVKFFEFSKWQVLGLTAVFLVNWGDSIVLRLYTNLNDIGIYNFAYQIFKGTVTASYIIYTFFLVHITNEIKSEKIIKEYLSKTRPLLWLLSTIVLFFLFLLIVFYTDKIYGDEYSEIIPITGILLIGTSLAVYAVFYVAIFNALKKYKLIQIILISQIAVNILLDFILVPHYGIYGSAIATVIGYGTALIIYEYYFRKKIVHLLS